MQAEFTEEQTQFRDVVVRFLQDKAQPQAVRRLLAADSPYDVDVWQQLSQEVGLTGTHIPEDYGGFGFSDIELGITLEEMGRHIYSGPFFASAVMTAYALQFMAEESVRYAWLPEIASGRVIGTLVIDSLNKPEALGQAVSAADDRLSGVASLVVDGAQASQLFVLARKTNGLGLYRVESDAKDLTIDPVESLDPTRRLASIRFDATAAEFIGSVSEEQINNWWDRVCIALSHEMIGGAQHLLDSTVDYTKVRYQFGRPIGSFQGLKHRLADLLMELEFAKAATHHAAFSVAADELARHQASMVKAMASDVYLKAAKEAIQMRGGIGFTWEENTHFWFKRAKKFRSLPWHAELSPGTYDDQNGGGMTNHDDIRTEVNAWIDSNWNPELSLIEWRNILVDGGWATPHWPEAYFGRDFNLEDSGIVARVFQERGVVPVAQTGPRRLAAETILAMGDDVQKSRYLRPILTGEESWCQLFSEPGSGSDLAGLSSKAEFVDGQWIINGQKVWNTSAHHADFGILVARTNFDLPKHQGISFFLIDMHQPGVEVRPLRQMNGHASFNEVFMTDAMVAAEDLVGGEGNGWVVAKTTLSYERRLGGVARSFSSRPEERIGRVYEEYEAELVVANEPYTWYPQRHGRVDLVLPRARETGAIEDPVIRQEIARLLCMSEGAKLAAGAAEAKRKSGSNELVPAGSISKLAASVIARQASHVHTLISGADAMHAGPASAEEGMVAEVLVSVPAISIAGGTDEIQRNIISERVMGMPKDIRLDTGPFRDIKRND